MALGSGAGYGPIGNDVLDVLRLAYGCQRREIGDAGAQSDAGDQTASALAGLRANAPRIHSRNTKQARVIRSLKIRIPRYSIDP